MLVLKRHYQFWFAILALHKIGAIAIPATNQLQCSTTLRTASTPPPRQRRSSAPPTATPPRQVDAVASGLPVNRCSAKVLVGGSAPTAGTTTSAESPVCSPASYRPRRRRALRRRHRC